ncbi:MAG: hypothetical protein ACRDPC_07405 [Solirubrobacteraceae bacterium]
MALEPGRRADEQIARGTYVASIAEGFEYGHLYNHGRLGEALAGDPR